MLQKVTLNSFFGHIIERRLAKCNITGAKILTFKYSNLDVGGLYGIIKTINDES